MMDAGQATTAMVQAIQGDMIASEDRGVENSTIIFDQTNRYHSAQIAQSLDEKVLQDNARRVLHRDIGPALMRLLTEVDEPLAVWLREVRLPIGTYGTNGGVRVIVETIPLRKVL